jgi:GT2 family glycosyltransferase
MQGLIDTIKEEGVDVSILIVDNASTPETYKALEAINDERVEILRSEKNLGFTGGINYALQYAKDHFQGIHYFFLLNPDAFSCPDLMTGLAGILEENKDAACVSPQILSMNGDPWYSGALINMGKGKVVNNPEAMPKNNNDYYEVDVFSGCAVLFDMQKVLKAGMFNESLFMYYDEADFSLKLKNTGYKILYTPRYKILHDVSYTTRYISHLKTYYMTRNKFVVFNDSMSLSAKLYFMAHEFAFHIKNLRFKNAYYHLRGFIDFKKKKLGQFINF